MNEWMGDTCITIMYTMVEEVLSKVFDGDFAVKNFPAPEFKPETFGLMWNASLKVFIGSSLGLESCLREAFFQQKILIKAAAIKGRIETKFFCRIEMEGGLLFNERRFQINRSLDAYHNPFEDNPCFHPHDNVYVWVKEIKGVCRYRCSCQTIFVT